MNQDIIEKCAYRMFEYEQTELGFEEEWCKSAWNNIEYIKRNYYKFTEIVFETIEEAEPEADPGEYHCDCCGYANDICKCN
jgi:hypothetical protein